MKEEIALAMETLDQIEEFRSVISKGIEALISFGPELDKLVGKVMDWSIERRITAVKKFEEAGFSREEAIFMTMDEWWGMRRALSTGNKNKK